MIRTTHDAPLLTRRRDISVFVSTSSALSAAVAAAAAAAAAADCVLDNGAVRNSMQASVVSRDGQVVCSWRLTERLNTSSRDHRRRHLRPDALLARRL